MVRPASFAALVLVMAAFASSFLFAAEPSNAADTSKVRDLLAQIRDGTPLQSSDAMHAMQDEVRRLGPAGLTDEILSAIRDVGLKNNDHDMRYRSYEVLAVLKAKDALPLLVEGLNDAQGGIRQLSCEGLGALGPVAKPAVPELRRLLTVEGLAIESVKALSYILGADANPILVDAYHTKAFDRYAQMAARRAFAEHPDPSALDIMTKAFREEPDAFTATYFEQLDRPESIEQFRWALASLKLPRPDESPTQIDNDGVVDARTIAARYLGAKRDLEAFDLVLKAASDPCIQVRSAAVIALGDFADPRAIDALQARLDEKDQGFEVEGQRNSELHEAAINALARINTPEALSALYRYTALEPEGANDADQRISWQDRRRKQLINFWANRASAEQFDQFLKFYAEHPLPAKAAAPILGEGLDRLKVRYLLPEAEFKNAAEAFYQQVKDKDVVPAPEVSADKKYTIKPLLVLYKGGFAVYNATFDSVAPHGYGHGYTVIYARRGETWQRIGKFMEWVE